MAVSDAELVDLSGISAANRSVEYDVVPGDVVTELQTETVR